MISFLTFTLRFAIFFLHLGILCFVWLSIYTNINTYIMFVTYVLSFNYSQNLPQ